MITIGIDLGTSNSAMAFHDGHGPQIIETPDMTPTMPSVISLENGGFLVGASALKRISRKDPQYIFSNVKRHIGRAYVEGEDYGAQGSQIIRGPDNMRAFKGPDGEVYTPERLSSEILKAMKAQAEKKLGRRVDGAVITYPAGWDNNRVKATADAGRMAGFKKVTLITEPEAAVLAYGLTNQKFSRVFVFDFGGGTLDAVLGEAGMGSFNPEAKSSDENLGGVDFDRSIMNYVIDRYTDRTGRDLRNKQIVMLKLAPVAEEAKRDLSVVNDTVVEVLLVAFDPETGLMDDISEPLTRDQFNEMTAPLIHQALGIVKRVMDYAERVPREVHDVLLVGGMTRVPAVRAAVEEYFGADRVRDSVPPDLAVAIGAAVKAAQIDGRIPDRVTVQDVTALPFGIETEGNQFVQIIPKGSPYGTLKSVTVTSAQKGQDRLPICVLQGENPQANLNAMLARYDVPVTPGEAASQTVTLDMMVDENGLLLVTGRDEDTGIPFEVIGP